MGILAIAAAVLTTHSVLARQLNEWQLVPRNQTFTELYFTNHLDLPESAVANVSQTVGFIVHSRELTATTYQYDLIAASTDNGTHRRIGGGTVRLAPGAYKTIYQPISMPAIGKHVMVKVALSYIGTDAANGKFARQTQSIDYFVSVASQTPTTRQP